MAQISFTVPDAIQTRVVKGVAYANGYQDTIKDDNGNTIPNPVTKLQFVRSCIKRYIKDCVAAYESTQAAETARQTAITSVNTDIDIGD